MLQKAGIDKALLESIRNRKVTYFGRFMRKGEVVEGTTPRTRRKGRMRTAWTRITSKTGEE